MRRRVPTAIAMIALLGTIGAGTAAAVPIRKVTTYQPGSYDGERYFAVRAAWELVR